MVPPRQESPCSALAPIALTGVGWAPTEELWLRLFRSTVTSPFTVMKWDRQEEGDNCHCLENSARETYEILLEPSGNIWKEFQED